MGFFTDEEQDQLRVQRMIIHVVGRPGEPFNPQPEVNVQEELFFRGRILAEASDPVHEFEANSFVKPIIEKMAKDEITFERGAQDLARLFAHDHVKQATSGAFFVFELDIGNESRVYALIKYDYREVVELSQADGKSILRAIVQAFVKEKRAVQKICLIRTLGGVIDNKVSASDRMHEAPDLGDYFSKYLGVFRARSDGELSSRLNEAMRQRLQQVRDLLPPGGVPNALKRMKQALQSKRPVTNDDVVDAALHATDRPEDEKIRSKIERKIRVSLRRYGLSDVSFSPDPAIFKMRPREYVRTAEEVRIEYPAEELGQAIKREERDGKIIFTVTTKEIVDDGTVANRSR